MKAGDLQPIEPHVRGSDPSPVAALVVRGGPLHPENLAQHATRQAREFSYGSEPMYSVSVDLIFGAWTLERILRERLWSRSTFATCSVGALQQRGFIRLGTHSQPHFDVILGNGDLEAAATLLAAFGLVESNPFKRRRR